MAIYNTEALLKTMPKVTDYRFNKEYDVITSHGTLHFVSSQDWKDFILKAKQATISGGIHIMQIFTNKIPASPDIEPFVKGLANEGELFALYADWEIVETKSYIFEDEHPGVEKHFHASNKIVARKQKLPNQLLEVDLGPQSGF